LVEHDVPLLGVNKARNLVELEPLARQIMERLILIGRTRVARVHQQLVDGVDRYVRETAGRAKAVALNESVKDLGALGDGQLVHSAQYNALYDSSQALDHFGGRLFHRERAATRAISRRFS